MLQRAADWPYGFLTFHEHDLRLMRGWHRTGSERVDENRRACQHLYDILRERKPVSPAVAVRLGKLFGDGAGVWVRMQAAYDTWNAERKEDVSEIPTLRAKVA